MRDQQKKKETQRDVLLRTCQAIKPTSSALSPVGDNRVNNLPFFLLDRCPPLRGGKDGYLVPDGTGETKRHPSIAVPAWGPTYLEETPGRTPHRRNKNPGVDESRYVTGGRGTQKGPPAKGHCLLLLLLWLWLVVVVGCWCCCCCGCGCGCWCCCCCCCCCYCCGCGCCCCWLLLLLVVVVVVVGVVVVGCWLLVLLLLLLLLLLLWLWLLCCVVVVAVVVVIVVVVAVAVVAVVVVGCCCCCWLWLLVLLLLLLLLLVGIVVVIVARVFSCQSPGCEAMALTPHKGCKVAQRRGGKQKE